MQISFDKRKTFVGRHIGLNKKEISSMLEAVNAPTIEALISETVPDSIRLKESLSLDAPKSEYVYLNELKEIAAKNKVYKAYIGMGYYNTVTPNVILRNIFENPGWYTAYTPYQAEIAQGRLEMLMNFQTMVIDLTGMEIANASLLDEGTAAAEAMTLLYRARKGKKKKSNTFFVSEKVFPQTLEILKLRAEPLDIEVEIGDLSKLNTEDEKYYGVFIQNPNDDGAVEDYSDYISGVKKQGLTVAMAVDLLAQTLFKSPGKMGADVVVGSSQRFGVPMGYGGPHAAFFATKDEFKRQVPGRVIGLSKDVDGKPAYRMALQTREQHIRREKATSNICTAQVLLAVIAGAYAVYHGPNGLRDIGLRVHGFANLLSTTLKSIGFKLSNSIFFDSLKIKVQSQEKIRQEALKREINFRYFKDGDVGISIDETTTIDDLNQIIEIFALLKAKDKPVSGAKFDENTQTLDIHIPSYLLRPVDYLTHEVFHKYHSETDMMRYLKRLENKDISLVHSMISLGSCTMKLNAAAEMIPVTWPEFSQLHPFSPRVQTKGYLEVIAKLEEWLSKITGFAGVSLQPNSGAQGEYAGLMVIRQYHLSRGDDQRNVVLIPSSAHGTNPASAALAGMDIKIVKCDDNGNIDVDDLKAKAEEFKNTLSALMVTYPSTHGVFEEAIQEVCQCIHDNGGLVYMDGANMNAQVGLTSPGIIGADVCHLNLHKTFAIPHGGGGPGMGPIGVNEKLLPFLPNHPVINLGIEQGIPAVSAAPWGSANVLLISYGYIAMLGAEGVTKSTEIAILNANYIMEQLKEHYDILYVGSKGRCAHELIVDCRKFKETAGIEVVDIAKRLMDYGFHAPTVSFPVAGTLMIEPTESESKIELDKFCEAMIDIRKDIQQIEEGVSDKEKNPLKGAPHTAEKLTLDWDVPYSRAKAVYPLEWVKEGKFWPSVSRIDDAYGDRNLICSCAPVSDFE